MDNFYWLHQIKEQDRNTVGDRGVDLSRLLHQNHPVISGVVISAQQIWQFLEIIDWRSPLLVDLSNCALHLDVSNSQDLQRIAQEIRHHILTASIPSSWLSEFSDILQQPSASALLFQAYLSYSDINITGIIDPVIALANPTAMAEGLKSAIAEFFHARSLFYWDYCGLTLQQLQPTILVQPLYSVSASGVIQVDSDRWHIKATSGLNLSIDLGETEPDYYQVYAPTHQIQFQKPGDKMIAYRLESTAQGEALGSQPAVAQQTLPLTAHFAASPLKKEILPSAQQTAWVLDTTQINTLIQLTQEASTLLGPPCQLRWILSAARGAETEQFYWYSVERLNTSPGATPIAPVSLSNPSFPDTTAEHQVLSGLGVSGGTAMAKAVVITSSSLKRNQFSAGSILVITRVTAEYFPLLKQAAGVVAELGGMTGHGAILARELGIPAVFGTHQATDRIQTGEFLLIEGKKGEVHLLGTDHPGLQYSPTADLTATQPPQAVQAATSINLMANISQPSSIERLKNLPIDGIGLLRSELLALDVLPSQTEDGSWDFQRWLQPQFQSEFVQRMAESLRILAQELAPKPIFYRALDLREFYSEARPFWGETHWEYVRLRQRLHRKHSKTQLDSTTLFDLEIAVLSQLHQWGYNNINLILPLVRSVEEFSVYQYWVKQAGLTQNRHFQLWIMAEVPSVLFLLPDYIKAGVEGIAIGTNDLTQFMFGINRNDNEYLTYLNASHPAVVATIKELIQTAKTAGIPCSICGDATVLYPELIQDFIRWGVTSLSVHSEAIQSTYQVIVEAEKSLLMEEVHHQFELRKPIQKSKRRKSANP
ncbi:MAG: putative PEP-binding protein [Microcoleaceae cyanobacterium]